MQDLIRFRLALGTLANAAMRGPVDADLAMEVHDAARLLVEELQAYRQADKVLMQAMEVRRQRSMMPDHDEGSRERIICRKLKISRATYHRARKRLSHGIETNGVSDPSKRDGRAEGTTA